MLSAIKKFIIPLSFIGTITFSLLFNGHGLASSGSDTNLSVCISKILTSRFSGYHYDPAKTVTHEQIREILEAGRLAPSSYNEQPWNFIVCERSKEPEAYNKAFGALVEFNQEWNKKVPVLIISIAATKSIHNGQPNLWGPYDTGAAAFAMMLKAASMGLMAHQMGGFDASKLQKEFAIPDAFIPMSVMAIGYPAADEVQPERKRKPIGDNFFMGTWGKKFE